MTLILVIDRAEFEQLFIKLYTESMIMESWLQNARTPYMPIGELYTTS